VGGPAAATCAHGCKPSALLAAGDRGEWGGALALAWHGALAGGSVQVGLLNRTPSTPLATLTTDDADPEDPLRVTDNTRPLGLIVGAACAVNPAILACKERCCFLLRQSAPP